MIWEKETQMIEVDLQAIENKFNKNVWKNILVRKHHAIPS